MKSFSAAILLAATFLNGLRAQEVWTASASPTTQNLWSVANGAGLFVAIGENGTLLTSPNGAIWTQRPTGTTNWLVGATYANGQFVVVGDQGLLLTSSDGITWTARSTGTSERLNGVTHGNNRWLAVGENGTAVVSTDGLNWSVVPHSDYGWTTALSGYLRGACFAYGSFVLTGQSGHIVTTADANFFYARYVDTHLSLEGVVHARHRFVAVGDGVALTSRDATTWRGSAAPAGLRAITFFNNTFVAVSADGSIATSGDAIIWTAHLTGTTQLLTAITGTDTTVVAVGFGGTILRSVATQAAPIVITAPVSTTEAAGNHVLLSVEATGSAPLSYQWNQDGHLIAGATSDTLALRAISATDAGRYTVTVKNALGSVTSSAATVTVIPSFATPGDLAEPTFQPSGVGTPSALLALPDGKILVASDDGLLRLTATGARDPIFSISLPGSITINTLVAQPDGKFLAGGTNGGNGIYLARFTADGSRDSSFAPASNLPGTTITQLAVQPDGKILAANATFRLLRLNADGSLDPGFSGADLSVVPHNENEPPLLQAVRLAPDGKIVVAAAPQSIITSGSFSAIPGSAIVARLNTDGSLDASFTPLLSTSNAISLLDVLPDGRVLFGSQAISANFGAGNWRLQRLNRDGTPDLTFLAPFGYIAKYGGRMLAGRDASGRITIAVSQNNSSPFLNILRFQPDGTPDTTLRGTGSLGTFSPLTTLLVQPDGRTLVSVRSNTFFRTSAINAPAINPPVALADESSSIATVTSGGAMKFSTEVAGTASFMYGWAGFNSDQNFQTPYAPSSDSVTFSNLRFDTTVYATITNAAGSITYPAQLARVPPAVPQLTRLPASVAFENGRYAMIPVETTGSGRLTYQWILNGKVVQSGDLNTPLYPTSAFPNTNPPPGTLQINAVTPETAGTYQLVLTNALGTQTAEIVVMIAPPSRLINVSTRGLVGTGDNTMIAGFVITGDQPKWVLLRGIGPGLGQFNIPGFLANPKLTLFDAAGNTIAENDDWSGEQSTYSPSNWPATFSIATHSHDAIISRSLDPGSYTVQVSGVDGTTGVALAEVYEDIHGAPRLVNLSSRVFVGTGEQIAISGFVIKSAAPKKLLIRAAGPALTQFNVGGTLADPSLTLIDSSGTVVATNNDWASNANQAELSAAATKVGAFPFETGSKDAAVFVTVASGSYTAVIRGTDGATGVALIEVYEVP